ncbi:MAG: hypothetical protein OM95_15730 [Bdellovibrio sp. ArHS]|uniref:hypothetical protein n=1 Tax=Bdellovibrio sp. ArHS TaxID=1569284 RepID=UPI0005831066|nr:hypothetical protein [Bdellovibrio sp. ArHS]KHD87226.1 MAG: hypothetical protein OM95_15730 [Bdellovibrio sp. ArHS]
MKRDQISALRSKLALFSATTIVLFFTSLAIADLGDSLVLCKHNKTVRTLRVEMGDDSKCRAIYTKQGVDETIGSGLNPNSCVEFVSNVRKNLEEAKWNCREVKEARTSNVLIDSAE